MGARILVIEDNPANLELISYLLTAFGHTPLKARDGEEGLSVARREKPDLILCDIQLPKLDGYGVVRALRQNQQSERVPCLAVTALAMVGDREKILAAGFDGYIAKPIVPESFGAQVEVFVAREHRSAFSAPILQDTPSPAPPPVEYHAVVLVVDNAPVNIQLVRSTLEPFQYKVISASNVASAVKAAIKHHPDLILSDLHMPIQDGFDFIKAVKAMPELRSIPFVFISSTLLRDTDQAQASRLGADRFICRPVSADHLLRTVTDVVADRRKSKHDKDIDR